MTTNHTIPNALEAIERSKQFGEYIRELNPSLNLNEVAAALNNVDLAQNKEAEFESVLDSVVTLLLELPWNQEESKNLISTFTSILAESPNDRFSPISLRVLKKLHDGLFESLELQYIAFVSMVKLARKTKNLAEVLSNFDLVKSKYSNETIGLEKAQNLYLLLSDTALECGDVDLAALIASELDEDNDIYEDAQQDVADIEDIGVKLSTKKEKALKSIVSINNGAINSSSSPSGNDYDRFTEEQLTDRLRGDLSKQGYRLIETHSAVKICRWTKNSMRGRGGCYKHTFYGIKSYQCMEMTPNLACASKCTFCWRHHKNPVGTEWKWKVDPPEAIVEQGLKNHLDMVRQLRGVPGVTKERFAEAQTVRHCALSLVGEPIFYPRINELLGMLHERRISTFLVTNAQFPDAMRKLVPVTQLYVSIDAPNKEALKKIDRPLYRDFWERYLECLKIISEKKQRTVFRLTLVQKANMEDLEGYAALVKIGMPDFIEIKGVTYCGTSKSNKLTMENVPWHEQVIGFAQELLTYLPEEVYELSCEHSHSNCALIANKKFKINGDWHTWIDYNKYFQLLEAQASGAVEEFNSLEYAALTPHWAIFGSEESGFDPEHMRWVRKDHKLKLLNERIANVKQTRLVA